MDNVKVLLGRRIRELRKAKNLTQEDLAEKVGIGTPNISYFETGKFSPAVETLQKIAEALEVEIYELYMFTPLRSTDEIRKELVEAINSNENLARMIYKFYTSVKYMQL